MSVDQDDKDDEYDSVFFHDRDAQNLRHIKQRKGRYIIYAMSVDQDDKDDEYDSRVFHNRDAQNMRRIRQRKGNCFIQTSSDDEDDYLITPYTFKISISKCNHHSRTPLLKPVCRFVSLLQSNRKSTRLRIFKA